MKKKNHETKLNIANFTDRILCITFDSLYHHFCVTHFSKMAKCRFVKYENPNRNEVKPMARFFSEAATVYCYFWLVCVFACFFFIIMLVAAAAAVATSENVICLCQNGNYSTLHRNLISFSSKTNEENEQKWSKKKPDRSIVHEHTLFWSAIFATHKFSS